MFFPILGFVLITIVDLVPLLRRRRWRDVAAWLAVLVPAVTVMVLLEMKVPFPMTMALVGKAMKAIGLSY